MNKSNTALMVVLRDLVETTDVPLRQKLQQDLLNYTFPIQYGKVMKSEDFLKEAK